MAVISNTSPLNYLVQIGAVDLLPLLFDHVYVPPAVITELQHSGSPEPVRRWVQSPPAWLEVRLPTNPPPRLNLGPGELEAIALAVDVKATAILIDDRRARKAAADWGLNVQGTLAVLTEAAQRKLIDLDQSLRRLLTTSFRVHPTVLAALRPP